MDRFTPQDRAALDRLVGEALLKQELAEALFRRDTRRGVLMTSLTRKAFTYIDERMGDVDSLVEFSQSLYSLDQPACD